MHLNRDFLAEGVWVVYCDHAFCNGKYLRDKFSLEKASDLKYPTVPIAELGGIMNVVEQAVKDLHRKENQKISDEGWGMSEYERYEFVVSRAIELIKEKQK